MSCQLFLGILRIPSFENQKVRFATIEMQAPPP
jgi:hypothetical protein